MRTLYYVHDPMCSWCYAFVPTWRKIEVALPSSISVEYVLGGLARDSDRPMPPDVQAYIRETWRRIQSVVPGTEFNFEFWTRCSPRRSTYPACRAVLAAKSLDPQLEVPMIEKIQTAYYREARNPSDLDTLCELATDIGIEAQTFRDRIVGEECQALLEQNLRKRRELGVTGFPSLVLAANGRCDVIPYDYTDPLVSLDALGLGHPP